MTIDLASLQSRDGARRVFAGPRENGEGVTNGKQEKERSNDRIEEVDEIEVDNRKRKRQDSASPLSRLIRNCRRSSNH